MKEIIELVWVVVWVGLGGWWVYMLGYESGRYDGWRRARDEQRKKEEGDDQVS